MSEGNIQQFHPTNQKSMETVVLLVCSIWNNSMETHHVYVFMCNKNYKSVINNICVKLYVLAIVFSFIKVVLSSNMISDLI